MSDISWVKIRVDMYDNSKMKIIDNMKNKNLLHYLWMSCILLAGRCNCGGELYLTDDIPYTLKTLAIEFRRTVEEVREAFKVFKKLKMIEVTENKVFYLRGWEKHQNIDGLDRIRKQTSERVAKYREKKRAEKKNAEENANESCNVTCNADDVVTPDENVQPVTQQNKKENEINKKENREESKTEINKVSEEKENKFELEDNVLKKNESENSISSIKNNSQADNQNNVKGESVSSDNNIYSKAIELASYCEKLTGRIGLLDMSGLNMAVEMYGSENVKLAIEKSIESGNVKMNYILGILRNWKSEGYPSNECDMGIKGNKKRYDGGNLYGGKNSNKCFKSDTNEFAIIKRREPRRLTEEERKKISANVI